LPSSWFAATSIAGDWFLPLARDMEITREEADLLAPSSISLKRIAECEEVASLVPYLASDLAHFMNGTMIEIDGGEQ
jgi:3-oxoacyl-[acyl-carrier protein] reductase